MRSAVLALAAVLMLGACSEDEPSAEPAPEPSPTASSSPSPPAAPSPTAKPQPRSTTGATYDIVNWSQYSGDPAVLAWKKTLEAAAGSLVRGKLQPGLRGNTTEAMFRVYYRDVSTGLAEGWQVKPVAKVHVESSKARGADRRVLRLCLWTPTSSVYDKNGAPLQPPLVRQWARQSVGVNRVQGDWRVADLEYDAGVCRGIPAPRKAGGA
jgi:hypothetical protein